MDPRMKAQIFASLYLHTFHLMLFIWCFYYAYVSYVESYNQRRRARRRQRYSMKAKLVEQIKHIRNIIAISDVNCVNNLRMDRNAFARLCYLLENVGGLRDSKHVRVCEQVAICTSVLSHHKKNRIIGFDFLRSGDTINHYFHLTLDALIKINRILYAKPRPIGDDCDNDNWKPFKGCVGALDGTHILLQVPLKDQNRFRSRKGPTSVNVLAVCDMHMQFICLIGVGRICIRQPCTPRCRHAAYRVEGRCRYLLLGGLWVHECGRIPHTISGEEIPSRWMGGREPHTARPIRVLQPEACEGSEYH